MHLPVTHVPGLGASHSRSHAAHLAAVRLIGMTQALVVKIANSYPRWGQSTFSGDLCAVVETARRKIVVFLRGFGPGACTLVPVIPRLDRGIQIRSPSRCHWIPRSSRGMTGKSEWRSGDALREWGPILLSPRVQCCKTGIPHTRSMMRAMPWPTPTHMVHKP